MDRGRLAAVVGVFLERPAPDGDVLVRNSVEERLDDPLPESTLLEVVHRNDLFPVRRNFAKSEMFAQINEIENVFLEAASAVANRCF